MPLVVLNHFDNDWPDSWDDADRVKPGMTVGELLAAYPHKLTVYLDWLTLPDYLSRFHIEAKAFSGTLYYTPSGDEAQAHIDVLNGVVQPPADELPVANPKPGETALSFASKSPHWRVESLNYDADSDARAYFVSSPEWRRTFTGTFIHFHKSSSFFFDPHTYYVRFQLKNGQVVRVKKDDTAGW